MSDGYWVTAYTLAGILVVVLTAKFYTYMYNNHMDPQERREFELVYTPLSTHPPLMAFLAMAGWVLWPLIVLVATVAGLLFLSAIIMDGYDWLRYRIGKLIERIKA